MSKTKKQISLFCQAKGGVGKSFLTFFKSLQLIDSGQKVDVVLLDSSQTALQNHARLVTLLGEANVHNMNILNQDNELKRAQLYDIIQNSSLLKSDKILIDFGASESNIFGEAILNDSEFSIEVFNELINELNIDLKINIVVSGSTDNIRETLKYFSVFQERFKDSEIEVNALLNDFTFSNDLAASEFAEQMREAGSNVIVVGSTGSRKKDTIYDVVKDVSNANVSLELARKNFATKIRLNNVLRELEAI